jgi:hypothetical protein
VTDVGHHAPIHIRPAGPSWRHGTDVSSENVQVEGDAIVTYPGCEMDTGGKKAFNSGL